MARPIRVEFANAVYHVSARGNERKPIFNDDADRIRFLETLEEMVSRFGVLIHAYCLMLNHHHLLIQTPRANLSAAAGWLQTTHSIVSIVGIDDPGTCFKVDTKPIWSKRICTPGN
jgi:REP element-mobilizing transposase RayT